MRIHFIVLNLSQVDQAVVSLVDKEIMRKKLNAIYETIRGYNKANAAIKLNAATSKAEEVAQRALNGKKVINFIISVFAFCLLIFETRRL